MQKSRIPSAGREPTWRSAFRRVTSLRTLRFAGIVAVALVTVWMTVQHREDGFQATPVRSIGSDTDWLRPAPPGSSDAPEIRLDDLADGLTFNRWTVGRMAQRLVGDREPVGAMKVGRFLDAVPRLRLTYGAMSIVLERRSLARIAQSLAGADAAVDDVLVGDLLDRVPYAHVRTLLRRRWLAGQLQDALSAERHDGPIATALREAFGDIRPVSLTRDDGFAERRSLQLQYAAVVRIVKDIQRAGGADVTPDLVYDQAFYRLVEEDRVDAVPLLDGHRRLQEELASDRFQSLDRTGRIAERWEARRRAFGPETAALLFSREEAMERFQIDRLAIAADPALTDEERAARIRERGEALKVELAAQGTYVSIPAESGGDRRLP